MEFPTFAVDEQVSHPHDNEIHGRVVRQSGGSVVVEWDNGNTDTVGALALDECRTETDLSDCLYYRGAGTCFGSLCGFVGEPRCITTEPVDGWPSTRPRATDVEA